VETLGHGSYLIIDGLKANKNLSNSEFVSQFLIQVAATVEPSINAKLEVYASPDIESGVSALAILAESHIELHTFECHEALSLRIFSRYNLMPDAFSKALKSAFGIKRSSHHLSNHSKTASGKPERRKKVLLGDRQYTSLRLDKNLMF